MKEFDPSKFYLDIQSDPYRMATEAAENLLKASEGLPNPRIPESVFVQFLPLLAGKIQPVQQEYGLNFETWAGISLGREVDVYQDSQPKNVLFSVPSLVHGNVINLEATLERRGGLSRLYDQARLLANNIPVQGAVFERDGLESVAEAIIISDDNDIENNYNRWKNIFARYGITYNSENIAVNTQQSPSDTVDDDLIYD